MKTNNCKIRIIERMRSDGVKLPQISEVKNRQDTRKSVTAAQDMAENEIITAEKLLTKRPAIRIKPKYFERIIGKKAHKKIKKDTAIQWEDIFKKIGKTFENFNYWKFRFYWNQFYFKILQRF